MFTEFIVGKKCHKLPAVMAIVSFTYHPFKLFLSRYLPFERVMMDSAQHSSKLSAKFNYPKLLVKHGNILNTI